MAMAVSFYCHNGWRQSLVERVHGLVAGNERNPHLDAGSSCPNPRWRTQVPHQDVGYAAYPPRYSRLTVGRFAAHLLGAARKLRSFGSLSQVSPLFCRAEVGCKAAGPTVAVSSRSLHWSEHCKSLPAVIAHPAPLPTWS